ncbi:MAG: hypothetical protein HXX09_13610 [Bacteroidetes bacterium]|nr:hypothetical protein [Bacteroidota bacterium]
MKIKLILTFLFISIFSYVNAQDETFKVLVMKGSNLVQRTSEPNKWKPLSIGVKLYKTDKIIVSDASYLGLVAPNGKTIELKTNGTYSVSDLAAKLSVKSSSIAQKYATTLVSDITNTNSYDKKKNMGVTGAVERGVLEVQPCKLIMPQSSKLLDKQISVAWHKNTTADGKYVIKLKKMFEDVLLTQETSDTTMTIDLSKLNIEEGAVYALSVSINNTEKSFSNPLILKIPTAKETASFKQELAEISGELTENTAVNKLLLASFYENNSFFIDAIKSYQEAIKLQPDIDDYKTNYQKFIDRCNIGQ